MLVVYNQIQNDVRSDAWTSTVEIEMNAGFIRQGLREGRIDPSSGITQENAEAYATFFLYGAWGMIYNGTFTEGDTRFDLDDVYSVVGSFIRNAQ